MHASGIRVDEELKKAFGGLGDSGSFLKICIVDDAFKNIASGQTTGDNAKDWDEAGAGLESGKPCYVCKREADSSKYILILYVPGNSPVRSKMLYAASAAALKDGLGSSNFSQDYHITEAKECSLKEFLHSTRDIEDHEIMTMDEMDAIQANLEAHMAISDVKTQAIVEMPINMNAAAIAAVQGLAKGEHSTVVLLMNPNSEECELDSKGDLSLDDVAGKLPEKEPRYVLSAYKHQKPEGGDCTSNIFIYYCPDGAKPKLKMFYSTCKSVAIKAVGKLEFDVLKNMECSVPKEVCDAEMMDELYPKKHEKKVFSKPKRKGKGKNKFRGKGFSAN